ncbi:MAG: hypothetical protein KC729_04455, partial [Candidatus Eisenbacteria bacterium]|nr:hypothetical protein [Candidatus Eisenbacteria bacterium]
MGSNRETGEREFGLVVMRGAEGFRGLEPDDRSRRLVTSRAFVRHTLLVALVFQTILVHAAFADDPRARAHAIANLQAGRYADALATCDSLLALDLSDLTAAYVGARAQELLGRATRARVRYLAIEGVAPDRRVGELARIRRHDLE